MLEYASSSNLNRLAKAVSKRCFIKESVVREVIPALFDELRYIFAEDDKPYVHIASFGLIGRAGVPDSGSMPNFRGGDFRNRPSTSWIKFYPSSNLLKEVFNRKFDPTRQSFIRHEGDNEPKISSLVYHPAVDNITIPGLFDEE